MMSFRKLCFMLILLLLPVSSQHLFAQTTSQVTGVVSDATGAVVANATVQMTNTDTGAKRVVQSNEKGEYTIPSLAIGPYILQVTKDGFSTYVQRGIVLELNTNPSVMVSLKPGSVTEEVDVTANAVPVETQNPAVNQVIDPEEVVDLPLNGREATDLIALSGAAVVEGSLGGTLDYPTAVAYSVAGSQSNTTNYNLDGVGHMDARDNDGLPMPFPDALSEFSVGISAMPANLGDHSGGMVNGSTKSGTNSFHGNLFEFVRNGFFDATAKTYPSARPIQGTAAQKFTLATGTKDTLQRNQFGGTFGGPIKKDKLFFFVAYQGTMSNSTVGASTTTLPTLQEQSGDFSYFASTCPAGNTICSYDPSGNCIVVKNGITTYGASPCTQNGATNAYGCSTANINAPYTGTTTNGLGTYVGAAGNSNVLNPALLATTTTSEAQNQTVIKNLEKLYQPVTQANSAALGFVIGNNCGSYHYQRTPTYTYEGQYVGRVDWQRTKNDTIFGSYFLANTAEPSYYDASAVDGIESSNGIGQSDRFQTLALGDTLLLGAHSINTIRLAFNREAIQRTSNTKLPTVCQLGVNVACLVPNNSDLLFGTKPGNEGWDMENTYSGTEGWAWANGIHQLNFGFTMSHVQMNGDGTFQVNPEFAFGTTSSPNSFSDVVIGNLGGNASGLQQGGGQLSRDGQNQPSAYIQDAWKVLPRLQLTGGLRWDPFFSQHNKYGMSSNFNLASYYANTGFSQMFPNMPPGVTFAGDQGMHGTSNTINRLNQFAPRAGFVWDITGKGKMTLRGGYGIFFDGTILWNTQHVVLNPPWGQSVDFQPLQAFTFNGTTPVPTGAGVANPYFGINGLALPSVYPSHSLAPPPNSAWVFQDPNNKGTVAQHWDLAFQRQLNKSLLFSATYLGNATHHIWLGINENPDTFLNPLQPNPNVTWTGTGSPAIGSGSTMDPTNQTSSPCTINYNAGSAQAPNIVGLKYNVCNLRSNATSTAFTYDTTGYNVTNANARKALNLANPLWGSTMQGLVNGGPGPLIEYAWGDAAYNGLLVSLQQRMSHNFSILGNYTWSRCMDDGEVGQDIGNAAANPLNPKQSSWGPCSSDRKGIGNVTITARTPRIGSNRMLNLIEYGWSSSAIFSISTGSYYNVSGGYDTGLTGFTSYAVQIANPKVAGPVSANTETTGCGPNAPGGAEANVVPTSVHNKNYWFNPCAFQLAPLGTYSGQVKNSYVGPSNWNGLNLALWRSFTLPERVRLDFRAEAFNALNHPGFGNPGASIDSNASTYASEAGYGLSTSSGFINGGSNTYRIMQFAIKASF